MSASLVLDRLSRPLYPLLLIAALGVLVRGHQAPGGGFVAGLIAVSATVLWAIAQGSRAARQRLPGGAPWRLAGAGVLLALLGGVPAVLVGLPFLTHLHAGPWASTVMLFDLGVAMAVWGALAGYVLPLLHEEEAPR